MGPKFSLEGSYGNLTLRNNILPIIQFVYLFDLVDVSMDHCQGGANGYFIDRWYVWDESSDSFDFGHNPTTTEKKRCLWVQQQWEAW